MGALAAAVALSWPGVQVARADGQPDPAEFERFMAFVGEEAAAGPAETCQAGGLQQAQVRVDAVMALWRRRAGAAAAAPPTRDDRPAVLMLNARGYNYGAAPDAAAQLGQLHQEMVRRPGPRS
jgi:hypothetical protein